MSVIYYSNFNNNKIKPVDFLLQREKNNASNNRSAFFEDNVIVMSILIYLTIKKMDILILLDPKF